MSDPSSVLRAEAPKTVEAFELLMKAAGEEGGLDEKTKQLMILGIAISHRNEYAAARHAAKAKKEGASRKEVLGALLVNISVSGLASTLPCLIPVLKAYDEAQ